jgi:hypothetical protein
MKSVELLGSLKHVINIIVQIRYMGCYNNQTKVLTTWFLNLPLDEYIDNRKAQSLNFESKTHEA